MTRLESLTRAKGWLDAFRPLRPDITEELRQRYEVRLTYHSTAIEGNTLTQSETQIVLEKGVTIGGKSLEEHLEVIGHRDALALVEQLATEQSAITERELREIHSLVMTGQGNGDRGRYRTINVKAAGTDFVYPDHLRVPDLMREFFRWLDATTDAHPVAHATEAHQRFVTIHPFRDGNGRVGRLLMNLLLLRSGYPIAVLTVERRKEYLDALVAAQSGGGLGALQALVEDAVEASLRETLEICATARDIPPRAAGVVEAVRAWLGGGE